MTAQLSLFGPRTQAGTPTCPRLPGPLCADAGRLVGGCPGAAACEAWTGPRPGPPADVGSRPLHRTDGTVDLAVQGSRPQQFGLIERNDPITTTTRTCGACGCTEAEHPITLYERAPLAGQYRCWACAQAALEST